MFNRVRNCKVPLGVALIAVGVAAFAAGGCGGSGGSDPPPLKKAAFIKKADAICSKSEKIKGNRVEALLLKWHAGPKNPISLAQQGEIITKASMPPTQEAIEEVGELGIPEGDQGTVEPLLEETEDVIGRIEQDPALMLSSKSNPFEKVAAKARAYGFKSCILYL